MSKLVGFVTGSASGLGKATALKLLQQGMHVVGFDKSYEDDNDLNIKNLFENSNVNEIEDLKKNFVCFKGNILSSDNVQNAINSAVNKWGRLNFVVNCAGISNSMLVYNKNKDTVLDLASFQEVVNTNVSGTFNVIRLAAQAISKNDLVNDRCERGVIINTGGIDAFKGWTRGSINAASFGAIASMTLPISRDLSSIGIRVITISPGYFETPMFSITEEGLYKDFIVSCNIFPGRLGEGNEFASCVMSVIENKMLNGEVIQLDAGCYTPNLVLN